MCSILKCDSTLKITLWNKRICGLPCLLNLSDSHIKLAVCKKDVSKSQFCYFTLESESPAVVFVTCASFPVTKILQDVFCHRLYMCTAIFFNKV